MTRKLESITHNRSDSGTSTRLAWSELVAIGTWTAAVRAASGCNSDKIALSAPGEAQEQVRKEGRAPAWPIVTPQRRRTLGTSIKRMGLLCVTGVSSLAAPIASVAVAGPEQAKHCSARSFAGSRYTVCQFDASRTQISIHWRNGAGKPYGTLEAVRRHFDQTGKVFLFAMNGGMYREDLSPVGYHVEARRKIRNANTRRGPGNFHMLPNGIFYVDKGRAGVMETRAFLRRNRRPFFATQSGPMLVIDGRIHPRFNPTSAHHKLRSGVGVSGDGRTVYFAISEGLVTFYNFAKLFEIKLNAPNALFLDGGSVPQMLAPGLSRRNFAPVGPIIAVTVGQ